MDISKQSVSMIKMGVKKEIKAYFCKLSMNATSIIAL